VLDANIFTGHQVCSTDCQFLWMATFQRLRHECQPSYLVVTLDYRTLSHREHLTDCRQAEEPKQLASLVTLS